MTDSIDWSVEGLRAKLQEALPSFKDVTPKPLLVVEGQVTAKAFRLEVYLAERFLKRVRKAKILKKPGLYEALAGIQRGYDPQHADPKGTAQGIFKVDKTAKHDHELAHKIYERFLFSVKGLDLLRRFGLDSHQCLGVKVTGASVCLLGCLQCVKTEHSWEEKLVLVDLEIGK